MYEGPFVTSTPRGFLSSLLSLSGIYGAKPILRTHAPDSPRMSCFQVGVSIRPLAQMHHWRDVAFVHIIAITFELCGRAL